MLTTTVHNSLRNAKSGSRLLSHLLSSTSRGSSIASGTRCLNTNASTNASRSTNVSETTTNSKTPIPQNSSNLLLNPTRNALQSQIAPRRHLSADVTSGRPAYLDNQSTTPVDPRVLDKMLPLFIDVFGNPHSRTHSLGWEAEELVEAARKEVALLIGANPKEIIFTSGATESNNMAIKGAAEFYGAQDPKKRHIITTQIEHKCVLASCRHLQTLGWDVTYLPVKTDGLICLTEFENAIRPGETLMTSIMWVNNEIGVVQPITEIANICKKHKVLFHTDGAQGVGKLPINVHEAGIDVMSISGHKVYGPKGIGALYVRGKPRVRLAPILSGGGQERGFRSGTLAAPVIVGFGEACRVAAMEMENDKKHITQLANRLYKGITENLPDVTLNGSKFERYYGSLNLSFAFVEGESLLMSLPQVAVSSGSACTSASLEPSYVLRAIGVDEELAHTSLRFGIGRFTSEEEVDLVIEGVVEHVRRLREMSPLWELSQEGGDGSAFVWT